MSPEIATVSVLLWAAVIAVYIVPLLDEGNIFERIMRGLRFGFEGMGRFIARRN